MLDRIGRLMDGVRQVSNAIAHDLRTPITRARARLEDAALHADSAGRPARRHRAGHADLDGIVAVFQALLRIAEIEAGVAPLGLRPLRPGAAAGRGRRAVRRGRRGARHHACELDAPAGVPAYGDQALIQQAIANLLDNAVKFSPPAATVRLDRRRSRRRSSSRSSDQGPGIPLTDREKATDRFFRGETARSTPGSGLGLSLVQAVAQLHGGDVAAGGQPPGPARGPVAAAARGRQIPAPADQPAASSATA